MLAWVKLRVTFSLSKYSMCVMFVRRFEPRGRRFTNFHYYYYNKEPPKTVRTLRLKINKRQNPTAGRIITLITCLPPIPAPIQLCVMSLRNSGERREAIAHTTLVSMSPVARQLLTEQAGSAAPRWPFSPLHLCGRFGSAPVRFIYPLSYVALMTH